MNNCANCSKCRNLGFHGFSEAYCIVSGATIAAEELDTDRECKSFDSRYIQYPLTITNINNHFSGDIEHSLYKCGQMVVVRPVDEEYKGRTFAGILLGSLPTGVYIAHNRETGELSVGADTNPAIFVPELGKIVYGYESWWQRVNTVEELNKQLTDETISNCWYVKALFELMKHEGGGSNA